MGGNGCSRRSNAFRKACLFCGSQEKCGKEHGLVKQAAGEVPVTAVFHSETLLGDWVCCTAGAINETSSCSIHFRFLEILFDGCGEVLMTEGSPRPERAWREIAEEVSKEHDSEKGIDRCAKQASQTIRADADGQ